MFAIAEIVAAAVVASPLLLFRKHGAAMFAVTFLLIAPIPYVILLQYAK